nr:TolC family protein [Campylobacteraceae bacterium]
MRHNTTILSLIAVLFLGGCSLSPQLNVPTIETPNKSVEALHVESSWWTKFGDAKLNSLIEEALANNDDLKLSALRILKAKQAYGLSDANRYPTLSANANATRQKTSDETFSHNRSEYSDHG